MSNGGHILHYFGDQLALFGRVAEKMWSGRPGKSLGLRGLATSAAGRKQDSSLLYAVDWQVFRMMRSDCPSIAVDERGLAASASRRLSAAVGRPIS